MADQADFPNIYIDGSSAGDGSEASPYSNISDINWTTGGDNSIFDYLAGTPTEQPTIYLAKGGEWRETITPGASGTATYPIKVTSYGSGADPIIKGSDLVATWTASEVTKTWGEKTGSDYTGVTGDTFIYEGAVTTNYDESVEQLRTKYNTGGYQREAIVSFDLSAIDGETVTNADLYLHIFTSPIINLDVRLYSCVDAFVEGTATWNTYDGSNAWTGTRGRGDLLDTQSLTNGQTGWVTFSGATLDTYINTQAGSTAYFLLDVTNVVNDRGVAFEMSESGDATERPYLSITYEPPDVWQAACTTEPVIVFFDDTKGTNVDSIAECTGANKWYWESNVLYVYAASDPDALYTTPGIEAGIRDMCIDGNHKAYITIDGLCTTHANGTGVTASIDVRDSGCNDWIVQNCDITYNGGLGLLMNNSSANFTVDSNTVDYNGGGGIQHHDSQPGGTVSNNTITYNETGLGIRGDDGTFENNLIHHNNLNGIYIHSTATGNIMRFNNIYTNGQASTFDANTQKLEIYSYGGNFNNIYYNLIHDGSTTNDTGSTGIYLDHGSEGNRIYNNTIYNFPDIAPGTQGHGIVLEDGTGFETINNIIKNNLISSCGSQVTFADDIGENNLQGNVFDNNCYHVGSGDMVAYADGSKTLAQWQAMTGSPDANSIDDDPLMTDPANGDFTLQTTSPCITTGVSVYANNIVENLSFEDDDDWVDYGTDPTQAQGSGYVRTGAANWEITTGAVDSGIQSDTDVYGTITSGKTYEVSVWLYCIGGDITATYGITADGTGVLTTSSATEALTNGNWSNATFTSPCTTTGTARPFVSVNGSEWAFAVDDFTISERLEADYAGNLVTPMPNIGAYEDFPGAFPGGQLRITMGMYMS